MKSFLKTLLISEVVMIGLIVVAGSFSDFQDLSISNIFFVLLTGVVLAIFSELFNYSYEVKYPKEEERKEAISKYFLNRFKFHLIWIAIFIIIVILVDSILN